LYSNSCVIEWWYFRDYWISYEGCAGASYYHSIGYVQDDETAESVSRTLEYAYDDWCVAQMAKTLGENGRLCPFDMI